MPTRGSRQNGAKPRASLLLDDQLCFALYSASRAVIQLYRPLLEELGLTYPQYLVMLVLWERGEVTIRDLAEMLELDYGTLSPLLKRLETARVLERQRRTDDERVVHVILTDEGRRLESRAGGVCEAAFASYGLDAQQLDALRTSLRSLAGSVTQPSRSPAAD